VKNKKPYISPQATRLRRITRRCWRQLQARRRAARFATPEAFQRDRLAKLLAARRAIPSKNTTVLRKRPSK